MQKSYLSSFHNDPRLTRYPNEKKIQPLFKKNFGQAEEVLIKHLEEDPQSNGNLNNRPISSTAKIKVRNISGSRGNNTLNRENLEFLINKLKSEKLEVYRDLMTYTEKYDNKLCMRARLVDMKALCETLLEMSRTAAERLNVENDLFGYLQMGTLTLAEEKFVCEESEDEGQGNEEYYQKLVGISGVACICLVKFLESGNLNVSIYPYLSNQAIAVDLDVTCGEDELEELLDRSVFPFLIFSSFSQGLGLRHLESPFGFFLFFLKIKFLKDPVEVRVELNEREIEISCLDTQIKLNDPFLVYLLYKESTLQASYYLSENLFYLNGDQKPLVWKAKTWEIEKHETGEALKASLKEVQEINGKFDEFWVSCLDGFFRGIKVTGYRNLVSGKFKILLELNEKKSELREEVYQEEFLLLLSFQDFDLKKSQKTLLKSLEFEVFVSKFVDFFNNDQDLV